MSGQYPDYCRPIPIFDVTSDDFQKFLGTFLLLRTKSCCCLTQIREVAGSQMDERINSDPGHSRIEIRRARPAIRPIQPTWVSPRLYFNDCETNSSDAKLPILLGKIKWRFFFIYNNSMCWKKHSALLFLRSERVSTLLVCNLKPISTLRVS